MDEKLKEKMDEVKSKFKDSLKKFGFSRSSPTFKGQGHTLGGSTQSRSVADPVVTPSSSIGKGSSSRPGSGGGGQQRAQQGDWRKLQQEKWERERGIAPSAQVPVQRCGTVPSSHSSAHSSAHVQRAQAQAHGLLVESVNTLASAAASVKSPLDDSIKVDTRESTGTVQVLNNDVSASLKHSLIPDIRTANVSHLDDPYSPILSSREKKLPSMQGFAGPAVSQSSGKVQCPVCNKFWNSEAEVSAHIDDCTGITVLSLGDNDCKLGALEREQEGNMELDLDEAVATFLSGNPAATTLEVIILRLLRNILVDPSADKFRKIRLENQKIKEAIVSATGGLRVFLAIGFSLVGAGSEKMLVMGVPSDEQKLRLEATIAYISSYLSNTSPAPSSTRRPAPTKMDRQLKIFYAPKDHLEERFELPTSFYELTSAELKLEAQARKKKVEDSQKLMLRSYKEKQAAGTKRRYKATVLRVQLPDGLILQGYFGVQESTTALYEFVASTLNDPHETFDLVLLAATKHRVIPRFLEAGGQCLTLEEADLIPKALLRFKPTGGAPFTGLKSEYYGLCEQLTLTTLLNPVDLVQN